ncbi:MAG: MFS transporter [Melioribacteraceae bacterium]|nr:MFS transporter [Melioribacteraceae bacterium]
MFKNPILCERTIYVIFGITLIAVMGVASLTPALPKIADTLNLSKSQVALLISAFTLPGIFLTPLAGILADRFGRKKIIVPALFLFAISGFSIFFTADYHYIILLRILQGIGAAPIGSLNTTLIGDYYKGKKLPEAMGYNASVLSLSTASYPLFGGFLAAIGWYYPFIMPLLAVPVGLLVILGVKEPEIEKPKDFTQYLKSISVSVRKREVISIFILGILTFIILYGAFLTYVPFLLNQNFDLSSSQIGLIISASSITTAIVSSRVGKLTAKFGSVNLLKSAFILYFFVNLLIPNITNLVLIFLPIILFGTAQALNIPSLQTLLAKLSPDENRGAFMSLNGMVIRLGQTLGPMVIGIGYSIYGLNGAYYLGAIISLLGLLVTIRFMELK